MKQPDRTPSAASAHACPKGEDCALNSGAIHCFHCRRNWPRDETWDMPFEQRPIREQPAAQDRPRRENPTDLWARELRLNERENVVSAFVMVMERHEIAEAQEIADEVASFFAKIEGAVERG